VLARNMFFFTLLGLLLPILCQGAFLSSDADPSPYFSALNVVKRSGSPRDAYLVVTVFISGPTVYAPQYDTDVFPIHAALEFAPTSTDGVIRVEVVVPAPNQISIRAVDVGNFGTYLPPNTNLSQYQAQEVWYLGEVAVSNSDLINPHTGEGLVNTAWGPDRTYRVNGHNSNDLTLSLASQLNITFPSEVMTIFNKSSLYISARDLSTTVSSVPIQLATFSSADQLAPTVQEFDFTSSTGVAAASSPQNSPEEVIQAKADTDSTQSYQSQQILTGPNNLNGGCGSSNTSSRPIVPRNSLSKRGDPTWGCGGKVNATAAKLRLGGPGAEIMLARSSGELSVIASLSEDIIKASGYAALALAPIVIILDSINGQWEAATMASIGVTTGIIIDSLVEGPIGFIVGAVVALLFNLLPGLFKKDVRPSSSNMTQIIQYAFYHDKDHTGNENCNANRTAAGLPDNCITLYGPGVLSTIFKWETFDAVAFLIQFNDGHPMTIPDIVNSFYNINWAKKGDGAGQVATVNCFPGGITPKQRREPIGRLETPIDTSECPSPQFSIDRTLINVPVINQTAAQIYPRIISNTGGDCKILSDSPNGLNYPGYNLTITGRPVALACNITASTDVGPTSSPSEEVNSTSTATPSNSSAATGPTDPPSNSTGSPTVLTSLSGWTYQSCNNDSVTDRSLVGSTTVNNDSMTVQWCAANCAGHQYFGVEFGQQCYCGGQLSSTTFKVADSECNTPCFGNATSACGATYRMQIYAWNSTTASGSSQASPSNSSSDGSVGRGYVAPPTAFPFTNLTGATLLCLAGSKGNMCFANGSYSHQQGGFGYSNSGTTELNMPQGAVLNFSLVTFEVAVTHDVRDVSHHTVNANQSAQDRTFAQQSFSGGIGIFGGAAGNTFTMDVFLPDASTPVICLFTSTKYQGDAACFGSGGGDLPAIYQSKAQSLAVHGNATVWLYAESYGDTSAQFVSTSVEDLATVPYNVNSGFSKQIKAMWVDIPRAS
jgi:hypothetical protein